jgi:HK97 gp10 family phage protein
MTLEGFEALQRAVTQSPQLLKAESSAVVRETTHRVADRMRRMVPTPSGTLLQAIEAQVAVKTGLTGRVTIGAEAFYWKFLEYGTVKMAARPFIRPAAEFESNNFIARMRAIGPRLERAWSRG